MHHQSCPSLLYLQQYHPHSDAEAAALMTRILLSIRVKGHRAGNQLFKTSVVGVGGGGGEAGSQDSHYQKAVGQTWEMVLAGLQRGRPRVLSLGVEAVPTGRAGRQTFDPRPRLRIQVADAVWLLR